MCMIQKKNLFSIDIVNPYRDFLSKKYPNEKFSSWKLWSPKVQ